MAIQITLTDEDAMAWLGSRVAGDAKLIEQYTPGEKKSEPAPTAAPKQAEKVADVVVTPALSGEDLRAAASKKAKALGAEGPAKVKAFVTSLGVKSIVDVAPEQRADALKKLEALA